MKNTLPFLISGLLLFGCSQKPAAPTQGVMHLVQAGTPSTWSNAVLAVGRRDGSSLAGITITHKAAGKEAIWTADKGTLSEGPDQKSVKVTLYNARMRKSDGVQGTFEEFPFVLTK